MYICGTLKVCWNIWYYMITTVAVPFWVDSWMPTVYRANNPFILCNRVFVHMFHHWIMVCDGCESTQSFMVLGPGTWTVFFNRLLHTRGKLYLTPSLLSTRVTDVKNDTGVFIRLSNFHVQSYKVQTQLYNNRTWVTKLSPVYIWSVSMVVYVYLVSIINMRRNREHISNYCTNTLNARTLHSYEHNFDYFSLICFTFVQNNTNIHTF